MSSGKKQITEQDRMKIIMATLQKMHGLMQDGETISANFPLKSLYLPGKPQPMGLMTITKSVHYTLLAPQ